MTHIIVALGFWFAIAVAAALLFIGIKKLFIWYITEKVKDEFHKNAPKVATNLCDKGHLYPSDLALKLKNIPGLEDDVDLCPLCYDINIRTAKKVLDERATEIAKQQNK